MTAGQLELEVEPCCQAALPTPPSSGADFRARVQRSRRPAPRTTPGFMSSPRELQCPSLTCCSKHGNRGCWRQGAGFSHGGGPPCFGSKRPAQGLSRARWPRRGQRDCLAGASSPRGGWMISKKSVRAILHRLGEDLQQDSPSSSRSTRMPRSACSRWSSSIAPTLTRGGWRKYVLGTLRNDTSCKYSASRTVAMMSSVAIAICWRPGPRRTGGIRRSATAACPAAQLLMIGSLIEARRSPGPPSTSRPCIRC